jgi:hypothetical protein
MPDSPELSKDFSKQRLNNVFALAKDVRVLMDSPGDEMVQRQKTAEFLERVCPGVGYTEFGQVLDGSQNPAFSEDKRNELKRVAENVGGALLIAGGDRVFDWATSGTVDVHMTRGMERVNEVVNKNIFVDGEGDTVGMEIVKKLAEVEDFNRKAILSPIIYDKKRANEKIKEVVDYFGDKYNLVNPDSDDARKLGAIIGTLNEKLVSVPSDGEVVTKGVEAIFKKYITNKGEMSTAFKDPNELLKRLGLEGLPDDLVEKLKRGVELKNSDIDGLDEHTKEIVVTHKQDLKEWIQSYKAKMMALNESLAEKIRVRGEVDDETPVDLEMLYEFLDHIENNGFKSDDLTRNSKYLDILYTVQMGHYTNIGNVVIENGEVLVKNKVKDERLKKLQNEIGQRLYLHDSYLAMSKCHTIEDYMRTLLSLYEGDIGGGSAARNLVGTILGRYKVERMRNGVKKEMYVGMGLKEIPVDLAWDLRQLANYQISGFCNDIAKSDWFLENLRKGKAGKGTLLRQIIDDVGGGSRESKVRKHIDDYNKELGVSLDYGVLLSDMARGIHMSNETLKFIVREFLWPEIELDIDKGVRLYKPVYKNFWLMERDGMKQVGLIKEYMLQRMQRARFDGDRRFETDAGKKEARHRVEKAFDLAGKASIAFGDNRADIKYSGNEYSPLLNFYWSRVSDSRAVIATDLEMGLSTVKNKFVGGVENIPYIWALAPFWLEFAKKDDVRDELRTPYSPLLVQDLDFSNINRGNDILFQFVQIVSSQSLAVSQLFTSLEKLSSQSITKPGFFIEPYTKINKIVKNAFADARVYMTTDMDESLYSGWRHGKTKEEREASTYRVAERVRESYVDNLYLVMRNGDATLEDYVKVRSRLRMNAFGSERKYNRRKKKFEFRIGASFCHKKEIDRIAKLTRIERVIRARDLTYKQVGESRWTGFSFGKGKK